MCRRDPRELAPEALRDFHLGTIRTVAKRLQETSDTIRVTSGAYGLSVMQNVIAALTTVVGAERTVERMLVSYVHISRNMPRLSRGRCFCCLEECGGVACERGHVMCAPCLDASMRHRAPVNVAAGIRCIHKAEFGQPHCDGAYPGRQLRSALSDESDALRVRAVRFVERLAARRAARERAAEDSLRTALEQCARGNNALALDSARAYVHDEILVDHCPSCALPFGQLTGCMATECSTPTDAEAAANGVRGCGAFFCGWCLRQSVTSAENHAHVAACPLKVTCGRDLGVFMDSPACYAACIEMRRKRKFDALRPRLPPALFDAVYSECV